MSREIEAPWKPKKEDQVTFNGPSDAGEPHMFHGRIKKILADDIVHIEATGGKWYEAHLENDRVRLVREHSAQL